MTYNKLETGTEYTLSQLFSFDRKIIVPDLQRDYCWGTKREGKELVTDFLESLRKGFENAYTELNLGLIYGYESPIKHIQLCDGQQRITTLFLILGILNKYSNNAFKDLLVSDFEMLDDKEPYLQYSIRESSLYFLSDLVNYYFLNDDALEVKDIEKQSWYFLDYNYDPSIQSMIQALGVIEKKIQRCEAKKFGNYLSNHLTFVYYDMGNRKNGEETFVVINTTGEPLSATENLKPLFINAQIEAKREEAGRLWEGWETWFWKHRKGAGKKDNDTADNGFNEFFRWITLMTTEDKNVVEKIQKDGEFKFDVTISVKEVNNYFEIIKFLFEASGLFCGNLDLLSPDKSTKNRNEQIEWFKLLPVVEYISRYGHAEIRNIQRVKAFFDNLARIENVQKSITDLLPKAINIIKQLPNEDIASMSSLSDVSSQILTEEEIFKFNLFRGNTERNNYEDLFWNAERHAIWSGEILPLLQWSMIKGKFSIRKFIELNKVFNLIFHDECDYDELDITRRALLTCGFENYPGSYNGYTNLSFCWDFSDWKKMITQNTVKFGTFLQGLVGVSCFDAQLHMIKAFSEKTEWHEFVKNPELLKYCEKKNIQKHDGEIFLIKSIKATTLANIKTYSLLLELKKKKYSENWKFDLYPHEGSFVCFNNSENSVIDIAFNKANKYTLWLFKRNMPDHTKKVFLKVSKKYQLQWKYPKYELSNLSSKSVTELIDNLIKEVSF